MEMVSDGNCGVILHNSIISITHSHTNRDNGLIQERKLKISWEIIQNVYNLSIWPNVMQVNCKQYLK